METSDSDDSFAWTSASSENSSSGCDAIMAKSKKKIFSESDDMINKDDSCTSENVSEHKSKKKKKKRSRDNSDVETYIKKEPESDIDTISKKKKKSKHIDKFENDLQDSMTPDESYLNLQVKQEKSTFIEPSPVKAQRKRSISITSSQNQMGCKAELLHTDSNQHKKSGKKRKHSEVSNSSTNNDSTSVSDECSNALSKKMKRRESAVMNCEKKFTDEKSDVKKNIKDKGFTNQTYTSKEFVDDDSSSDESMTGQNPVTENNNIASSTFIKDVQLNGVPNVDKIPKERLISGSNNLPPNINKHSSKISERIQFEDEEEVETNTSQDKSSTHVQSALLRRFLRLHYKHLKAIFHAPEKNRRVTNNDDIWVLKFPHDINIKSLIDTNITIDRKCKLKVNSQTYEGTLDSKENKISILTAEENKCTIGNIAFNGIVNFRKRIPKAHYVEDNIIANNQTNFIPLPDTKCRHPLFGANYKKAIRLPDSIKERLNSKPKKKKKQKKDKQCEVPEEIEVTQDDEVPIKKKKRKRKHSTDEGDPLPKKAKRLKRDPDSTEAWESAQDIEKKLFNF